MADEAVKKLLEKWDMVQLMPQFTEQEIDYEALKSLTPELISQLIPKIGLRAKFQDKYKEFLCSESYNQEIDSYSYPIESESELNTSVSYSSLSISSTPCGSNIPHTVPTTSTPIIITEAEQTGSLYQLVPVPVSENLGQKRKFRTSISDLDLKTLLEESCVGQAILAIYKTKEYLEPKYQNYLVQIIIVHILTNREKYGNLTNDCFDELADKIIDLFPLEQKSSYYIRPLRKSQSKDKKSGISRGKLPDKYKNKISLLKEAGIIPKHKLNSFDNPDDEEQINDEDISSEATNESVTWLKHNKEPEDDVLKHWKASFSLRRKQFQSQSFKTLDDIYEEWPILKLSIGSTLIDKDFENIFENKGNLLLNNFDLFFDKALSVRKSPFSSGDAMYIDLLQSATISTDSKHLLKLFVLSAILPPKSVKIKKWKPSIAECREGMVLHVKIPGDINSAINKKRDFVKKLGLTLQPFIVVEAPSVLEIKNVFVYVNSTLYETRSVLKAIDLCLKAFLVFNASYPPEAEHLWTLMQWQIFNIHTPYDVNIPYVYDFTKLIDKIK